jgi:hypothetical protein
MTKSSILIFFCWLTENEFLADYNLLSSGMSWRGERGGGERDGIT